MTGNRILTLLLETNIICTVQFLYFLTHTLREWTQYIIKTSTNYFFEAAYPVTKLLLQLVILYRQLVRLSLHNLLILMLSKAVLEFSLRTNLPLKWGSFKKTGNGSEEGLTVFWTLYMCMCTWIKLPFHGSDFVSSLYFVWFED